MEADKKKKHILCFLSFEEGRDVEILLPVCYYAEKYLNAKIVFFFIWDLYQIYLKQPDIILLPNIEGSQHHYLAAKYALSMNIPVFSSVSEGNIPEKGDFYVWGYIKEKEIIQDYYTAWSKRHKEYLAKQGSHIASKTVLTGGSGFDRYVFRKFPTKERFLEKYQLKSYKKVVCYAGWGFGKFTDKKQMHDPRMINKDFQNKRELFIDLMYKVEGILRKAIEANPDILFVLKKHPTESLPTSSYESPNEMNRITAYNNVLYLNKGENIDEVISASDMLLSFYSTTAIQNYLMGQKPSLYICTPDFMLSEDYKAAFKRIHSHTELQKYMDTVFAKEKSAPTSTFVTQCAMERIIEKSIGFSDGLNHLRIGYFLEKSLKRPRKHVKKRKFNLKFFIWHLFLHSFKYLYYKPLYRLLPKFSKTVWIFDNYRLTKLYELKKTNYKSLDRFYKENSIPDKINDPEFWKYLIEPDDLSK